MSFVTAKPRHSDRKSRVFLLLHSFLSKQVSSAQGGLEQGKNGGGVSGMGAGKGSESMGLTHAISKSLSQL